MKHLFKLKKDGKTVGYLNISKICMLMGSIDGLDWRYITNQNPAGDLQLSNNQWIHFFDTAHPFVTKDKNGKDVFAGDKAKFYSGVKLSGRKEIKIGTVIYEDCQFKIDNFPLSIATKFLDIELIEDKGE